MSAIEASSVGVKTMADGTLRITCDIEPAHAQAAFSLFGAPGTPMALAALKVGHAAKSDAPEPEKPKGGPLAKLAGQWCEDEDFQNWFAETRADCFDALGGSDSERVARALRFVCGVTTRAALDHDKAAAQRFDMFVRTPYRNYLQAIGVAA